MVTLAEFYTKVSAELRRGTSFDSVIPMKVGQAVKWMESQHTFLYMEKFGTVSIPAGTRNLGLPAGFKSMFFWRIIKEDGSYRYLPKISPKDADAVDTAMPKAYWQNAKFETWFDSIPDKTYSSERSYVGYTVLGLPDTSPEVLQLNEQIIFHQTCVLLSTTLRDGGFGGAHKGLRDEAMKAAIDADVEERQNNESPSVQYGWEHREQINEEREIP